jgi:hypothetical protein
MCMSLSEIVLTELTGTVSYKWRHTLPPPPLFQAQNAPAREIWDVKL